MATIDTIKNLLEENLGIDPSTVTEDSTLESLDIDSLDMVELITDLEDAEGIDFGEPEGIETVGDIVKHVDSLK
ncbi:MAG: phosphopantetheine-binding protein [Coriobacteriales bacterium]|jgi:acyl carrier protein